MKSIEADAHDRILLVDDEPHVRRVLQTQLRKAGYEVLLAPDGQEALDLAREHLPRVLVTDYQMPLLDGLALARALSAERVTAGIPIILLTAHGSAVSLPVERTNIVALVTKPFSPREIVRLVTTFAGRSIGVDRPPSAPLQP
jgi:CheY-like chemotaxis protein